jgi:hypothetical protein
MSKMNKDIFNSYTEAGCIEIFDNVISEEASKKIIKIFEDCDKNVNCPAKYSNARVGAGINSSDGGMYRSNQTMNFSRHDCKTPDCKINEAYEYIIKIYDSCVKIYEKKYGVEIGFDEGFQVLKYSPGNQYKAHSDQGPGHDWRTVSGLILLNPKEYVSGGTHFVNFNVTVKPENPSIILFPSNYAYTHSARPVLEGIKYAIVTWMGPPWAIGS